MKKRDYASGTKKRLDKLDGKDNKPRFDNCMNLMNKSKIENARIKSILSTTEQYLEGDNDDIQTTHEEREE
jgi:hypothetical protein